VWLAERKGEENNSGVVKMEPVRDSRATLVDLLDRALDKGIMLDADLMISMAGIPLIGIKLKAAIAGIATMLEYGLWNDWDEAQRAYSAEESRLKAIERRMKELGLSFEMRTVPMPDEEKETCPSCGIRAPVMELLHEGCKECGWVSPRLKEKEILTQLGLGETYSDHIGEADEGEKRRLEQSDYYEKCPICGRWQLKKHLIEDNCYVCGYRD
jgi:hypothetical protein